MAVRPFKDDAKKAATEINTAVIKEIRNFTNDAFMYMHLAPVRPQKDPFFLELMCIYICSLHTFSEKRNIYLLAYT